MDIWGNPTIVETKYGNDVTETVASSYTNTATDTLWLIGLPLTVEKKTVKGVANWIDKSILEYNGKNFLWRKTNYTGDVNQKASKEEYNYDGYGNILSSSVKTFSSGDSLKTVYTYKPDKVFLESETNSLQQTTQYNYNSYGQLFSKLDYLGHTTTYEYDDMGRQKKTNYPDGTNAAITYLWGGTASNSVYYTTGTSTGSATEKQYYDAVNRLLRTSVTRYI